MKHNLKKKNQNPRNEEKKLKDSHKPTNLLLKKMLTLLGNPYL